eukprot:CAMPEP_0119479742 /NCGR_PEP_ID=MMETSP1344-20130328/8872_1 /TAXON_ID=236787 /ORGANISM="Florenciella parvula, Strain CCMP2471" /LENGTH=30 /DNA_ID= /DNA_START= /DNA_END= /DNA_ORIENTATION=
MASSSPFTRNALPPPGVCLVTSPTLQPPST